MAIVGSILGLVSSVLSFALKQLPLIISFFQGKKEANAEHTKEALNEKIKADREARKTRDILREEEVGDYIRNRDI